MEGLDTRKRSVTARHEVSLEKRHKLRGREATKRKEEKGRFKKEEKKETNPSVSAIITDNNPMVLILYLSPTPMTLFASILHVTMNGCLTQFALITSQMSFLTSQNIIYFPLHAKPTLPTRLPMSLTPALVPSQERQGQRSREDNHPPRHTPLPRDWRMIFLDTQN